MTEHSILLDNVNAIDTSAARVWSQDVDIVVVQIKEDSHLGPEATKEIHEARLKLSKGFKQRVLIDARACKSSDSEAWDFSDLEEDEQITKVMAYLAQRPVEKNLMSYYFAPGPNALYQCRLFMEEKKAFEWLDLFKRIDM